MDTRRLDAFIKVVDLGSVTRAAKVLSVAQPALSQQIIALEAEFERPLLVRSTRGVTPTEAGRVLYRYAQSIRRQLEEARRGILETGGALTGNVTVGLAPLSSASLLASPLLTGVHAAHPGIVLHIFDSFGITLSELMLNGRMDMAVLYGADPVQGLDYRRLGDDAFHLVGLPALWPTRERADVTPDELAVTPLVLPSRDSFLRQAVERTCAEAGARPRVVAEVQSRATLSAAVAAGLGATVLPPAIAEALPDGAAFVRRRIASPSARLQLSLGISDHAALSDAAFAVYAILKRLACGMIGAEAPRASSDLEAAAE